VEQERHGAGERDEDQWVRGERAVHVTAEQSERRARQAATRTWQPEEEGEGAEGPMQSRSHQAERRENEKSLPLAVQEGADFFPFTRR
jgi:hypothetical protein